MKENVTIEQMIAFIMSMKNLIGEFSVDMYYDDVTSDDNEKYVVKLHGVNEPAIYFRCKDLKEGLNDLFHHLTYKIFK
jgi:hypothetical protein